MNSKNKTTNIKILVFLIIVVISIVFTIIMSILYSSTIISYIINSYFPVWIFMLIIISHYGYTHYVHNKNENNVVINSHKANLKKASKVSIFFLFVQILMSFSSLLDIMKYSNRKTMIVIVGILAIFCEVTCIKLLYSNLKELLNNNNSISNNKMRYNPLLYIVLYVGIYTLFVSLVILDYYI